MRILFGDVAHEVSVQEGPSGQVVNVDGQGIPIGLEGVAPGPLRVVAADRAHVLYCARDGDVVHLSWDGAVYRLGIERSGARAVSRATAGSLEAPMPGKVIAIKVAPGEAVRKGDELLVVEAMKMENALRAPRAGVVKLVRAQVGDMVSPGTVLVELE